MATYGIDLGTTYSAIATLDDDGKPVIIKNDDEGTETLASAVYFPEGDWGDIEPVVGNEAKNMQETDGDKVIQFIKRDIGKSDGRKPEFGGKQWNPISISALILKRIAAYAKKQGKDVKDVIITCPAYFGIEERNATRQAGEEAGFNVMGIINEPTAAALNYCAREVKEAKTIMVYDLGGGTFDVTILKMSVDNAGAATIETIRFDGDDRLGGKDWDDKLFDLLLQKFADENGSADDTDLDLRQAIRNKVEETKKQLSLKKSTKVTISYQGVVKIEVTREEFFNLTKDILDKTLSFVDKILIDAGEMTADNIDLVLLVGGSTRMPMVFDAVSARFPGKTKQEDPDLAVAKGAAIYAGITVYEKFINSGGKEGGTLDEATGNIEAPIKPSNALGAKPFKVIDKAPRSFGPGIMTGETKESYRVDNLIFKGSIVPAEKTETYYTQQDGQEIVRLKVFENASEDQANRYQIPCEDMEGNERYTDPALKMKRIGTLDLNLPSKPPANSEIIVTFRLGTDGLYVKAINPAVADEKNEATLTFENALTEAEMVKEKADMVRIKTTSEV
jgi:molecular chaperone DnaK (HSP70)